MQLSQIVRRTSFRLWALALVPALVLGTLMFLVTLAPPTYHLRATVGIINPTGADTAATVTQSVDSFRSALTTQAVRDAAAEEVGLDRVRETDVVSSRVGVSNLVDITVTVADRDDAEPLVHALVEGANELLFAPALNAAEAQRDAAGEIYDQIQSEIDDTSSSGLIIPVEQYRSKASEVTQLRVALAAARARSTVEASQIESSLRKAREELGVLSAQVRQLDDVSFRFDRARTRLADNEAVVSSTESRLVAANDDSSVAMGNLVAESRTTVLLRALVAGLVVSVAVVLGLVLLVGALRRGDPDLVAGTPRESGEVPHREPGEQPA